MRILSMQGVTTCSFTLISCNMIFKGTSWAQSLTAHIRTNMGVEKWFQLENFVEFRNSPIVAAISTLFPDQYIAGDAIKLAIKSLSLTIGPDAYLADVLVSHLLTERILRIIKKKIQQSNRDTFDKILIPINVNTSRVNISYRHTIIASV